MVHVVIDTSDICINNVQYGGGGAYFTGVPFQRGGGLGGTLLRFWRFLVPIIKPVARELGKEGLHAGARILDSVAAGQRLPDAIVEQGRESVRTLAQRVQSGSGVRRKRKSPVILKPSSLKGRLCSVSVPTKKLRRDTLGLY